MTRPPPISTLFPYTTLFRSLQRLRILVDEARRRGDLHGFGDAGHAHLRIRTRIERELHLDRSEEHTSELQSLRHLVCRLLLEKKKKKKKEQINRMNRR